MEIGKSLHRSAFKGRKINVRPTVTPQELARIAQATEKKSMERRVCFAFQKGRCKRGSACMFLHQGLDQKSADKQQPVDAEAPHKRQKKIQQQGVRREPESTKTEAKPPENPISAPEDRAACDEELPEDEYAALLKQFRDSTKEHDAKKKSSKKKSTIKKGKE